MKNNVEKVNMIFLRTGEIMNVEIKTQTIESKMHRIVNKNKTSKAKPKNV